MSEKLTIGFIAFGPTNPNFSAAAAAPPPGSYSIGTIGGPRSLERIKAEIAACEQHLQWLKSEMSGHPDYKGPA
jgi:hypothetical protein